MQRLLGFGLLILLLNGCKDRGDNSDSNLFLADASAVSAVADHAAPAGSGPSDVLTEKDRNAFLFGVHCGVGSSKIKLFNPAKVQQAKWAWFEEKSARQWASPSFRKTCAAGETYEGSDGYCWAPYQLQMFPVASSVASNHYLVAGTSPIIRVFPAASYPKAPEACRFDNDTAFIFVAGVNNHYLGESWKTTDKELLASIMAWNRNRPEQATGNVGRVFSNKMTGQPGYIQVVGNSNSKIGGVFGAHNEPAIELMIRNLELAFRSGVSRLEVVSHSNGMITVHSAIAEFSRQLVTKGSTWLAERNSANPGVGKLKLQLFHLQAAPSQKWSNSKLDKFENYSDFLPNARWEKKSALGIPYWGWEWDFKAYTTLETYASLNIDYFYNAPDGWTYPWTSSVGRTVSNKWHEEVQKEAYKRGIRSTVNHNVCEDRDVTICGPAHSQKDTLWDFANPGFSKGMNLISWRTDIRSGPVAVAAFPNNAMLETAPKRLVKRASQILPDLICLDVGVHREQCKKLFAQHDSAPVAPHYRSTTIPELICAAKTDQQSICNTGTCGDGICALGEADKCSEDCRLPDTYESCSCVGALCNTKKITCKSGICELASATPVSGCQCPSSAGVVKCDAADLDCEILKLSGKCLKSVTEQPSSPAAVGGLNLNGETVKSRIFQK